LGFYLHTPNADSRRIPHVAWQQVRFPKSRGRLGLKDYVTWNRALIAKLVWAVAHKKDILWVKWIHGRYLKNQAWWDYSSSADSSWHWKKICKTKELFKEIYPNPPTWEWKGRGPYKVTKGYSWSMGDRAKVTWAKIIWARPTVPRHAFILWVFLHHKLLTLQRLTTFDPQRESTCHLCK